MDWFGDHWPETWLFVALALAALELVSTALILVMLAGGALVAMVTAMAGGSFMLQVILGIVASIGLLSLLRPPLIRRLHAGQTLVSGTAALVGKRALVLEDVSSVTPGRVKIGGDVWTARPSDERDTIEAGTSVEVASIEGAIAYVHRSSPSES